MYFTAWAMLAVLGVYFWTGVMAGYARVKYKVAAPSMEGPSAFQSAQRVQANTLEQLPIVIVPLWLCATYLGDGWPPPAACSGARGGLRMRSAITAIRPSAKSALSLACWQVVY